MLDEAVSIRDGLAKVNFCGEGFLLVNDLLLFFIGAYARGLSLLRDRLVSRKLLLLHLLMHSSHNPFVVLYS